MFPFYFPEATLKADYGGKITKDNECKIAAQFMYCTMKKEETVRKTLLILHLFSPNSY
jgi:hypothetical protein